MSDVNGRRWYDPVRLLVWLAGIVVTCLLSGGSWALGHIAASDVKNASQDTEIQAIKDRMERVEKGVDRANMTLDEISKKLIGGGK
jgi:hypothetical protein